MALQQISGEQSPTQSDLILPGNTRQEDVIAMPHSTAPDSSGRFIAESPAQVFGPGNQLNTTLIVDTIPHREVNPHEINVLLFNGILIALFLAYTVLLFRYRSQAIILLKATMVKGYLNNIIEEQSLSFRSFITSFSILGGFTLLSLTVKAYLLWTVNRNISEALTNYMPLIVPILLGVILSILLYRRIINAFISKLSMQRGVIIGQVQLFSRIIFTLFSLTITPLAILCGLTETNVGGTGVTILSISLIIFILYYMLKSISFFIERKISILQWFLYLCAVEIWPISFYVLFALRDFQL